MDNRNTNSGFPFQRNEDAFSSFSNNSAANFDYNPHRSRANSDSPYNRLTGRYNPVSEEDLQAARMARAQRAEERAARAERGQDTWPPRERRAGYGERRAHDGRGEQEEAPADELVEEEPERAERGYPGEYRNRSTRSERASKRAHEVRAQRRGEDARTRGSRARDGQAGGRQARGGQNETGQRASGSARSGRPRRTRTNAERVVVNEGERIPRRQVPDWYEADNERAARRWEHNRAARERTQEATERAERGRAERAERPTRTQRAARGERSERTERASWEGRPTRGQQAQGPRRQPSWYDEAPRSSAGREPRAAIDTTQNRRRWDSRAEGRTVRGARNGYYDQTRASQRGGIVGALQSLWYSLVELVRNNTRLALAALVLLVLAILIIRGIAGCVANANAERLVAEEAAKPKEITISFVGDCTLGTDENFNTETSFNKKFEDEGAAYFFANVRDTFNNDDLTIVNLEGPLTTSTNKKPNETYNFKGAPEYVDVLTQGGVEAASLGNNHSYDYGEEGYQQTISTLDNAGVLNFGYDRIAYTEVKGVKIAMVSGNMVDDPNDDLKLMIDNIGKAKDEGAKLIIAYPHWGIELDEQPGGTQMQGSRQLIDAGATVVVGAHPHVIQGYEKYNGRYVVYSLANFCFGGNDSPRDSNTWIFQQTFTVDGEGNVSTDDAINIIPCSVSSDSNMNNYQPTPATGEAQETIMKKINDRTAAVATLAKEFGSAEEQAGGQQAA